VYRRADREKKLSEKILFHRRAGERALAILDFDNRERFFRIKVFHIERCQIESLTLPLSASS
jgi:hypothetical protein